MFTSRAHFLTSLRNGEDRPIDAGDRAYFQSRLRNRIFDLILTKFVEQQKATGLTKAILARRIERAPAVITRLLSEPSNLTIETISDLLLGIAGEELDPISSAVDGRQVEMKSELKPSLEDKVVQPHSKRRNEPANSNIQQSRRTDPWDQWRNPDQSWSLAR